MGLLYWQQKPKILIVDDDQSILISFKKILKKAGFVVETADTGEGALKKMEKEKFNVYLVDVRLPDIDGTDLLLAIPKDYPTVKIIVTGFSSEEVGKKAADYGADDYLVKPVKPQELVDAVKEKLGAVVKECKTNPC